LRRILSLALVLSVAAGLFAQGVVVGDGSLTINSKVASGLAFDSDDQAKTSETGGEINAGYFGPEGRVRLWNDSDAKNALRADLSLTYSKENGGFKVRLRAENLLKGVAPAADAALSGIAFGRYAYGWVELFGDRVKMTAGLVDLSDNVWGTKGDGDWDIGGNGLRLELRPLEGLGLGELSFGAFLLVPSKENSYKDANNKDVVRKITLRRTLEETAFGLRYAHPRFYAGAQLQLDGDIDGTPLYGPGAHADYEGAWSPEDDEDRLMLGAGITGVPNLVLTAEGNFQGLGCWEARGAADLRQTVSYTLFDKLTIGAKAKELLWGYDLSAMVDWPLELRPWMQLKPFVSYELGEGIRAGLEGGYGFGHLVNGDPKDRKFVNEKYDVFVKPNISCAFDGGLALKAWYQFTAIGYSDLGSDAMFLGLRNSDSPTAADAVTKVASIQKHQVALEFVWSY